MSIKPTDVLQALNMLEQTGRRSQVGQTPRTGFADVLASVASGGATDARMLAQWCRMEMMRGSIGFASDTSDHDFERSFPLPLSSLNAYKAASQGNDPLPAPEPTSEPIARKSSSAAGTPITDLAHRAAERYDIDPALVKAVIKAESDFKPDVVSGAGAQGLMQLMPGTARDLGVTDPFDPEQNVMGGTRYLKQLLTKYDGDLDKTLAAYNWGPGNVDRKGIDILPEETRTYLSRVKRFQTEFMA